MADVSSPQRKQKVSLGGFLESNSGSSSTHHARQEEAGKGKEQDRSRVKPKRTSSSKLKRRSATNTDESNKDPLSNQLADDRPAILGDTKKREVDGPPEAKEETQKQPRSSSKTRSRRGPPPRSKSFNLDGIMSAEGAGTKPFFTADEMEKEKGPSVPTKADSTTEASRKPASSARGKRAAFSRSKSFNLDGKMSAEGAGATPFAGTDENGGDDKGRSLPVTGERALPTRSQSSKGRRSSSSAHKPISRGRSFDDTGNTPMHLKRIPRNPQRGIMLEKQPSQRNMRPTVAQEKGRRGGKKTDRSPIHRTSNSGSDTKNEGTKSKTTASDTLTENETSTRSNAEKTKPQQRTSLEFLQGPTVAEQMAAEKDADAFTVNFPDTMEVSSAIPTTNLVSTSGDGFSATTKIASPKKKVLDMTLHDESDDSDEDGSVTAGGDQAGIIQFDPTALDNVKVVRQDSHDEFPTDYLGCAVDMGLTDTDNTSTNAPNNTVSDGVGGYLDDETGTPSSLFAKAGRGFFQSKKLTKSGSFRVTKKKSTAGEGLPHIPTISASKIAHELEEAAAPITQATAAMGAAVANLTKGWTITSSGVQRQHVGHQHFEDGDAL